MASVNLLGSPFLRSVFIDVSHERLKTGCILRTPLTVVADIGNIFGLFDF